ncbi:hypothetical protein [Bartonella tamiae]|uniref:Uncharacterized protein n=1 Tax=Bartonella tamiae Th239 TaxID=1094558 RepID=J0ZSD9_9HYPH|nr:hypothetical protein [Bartonella tamiae]EJF91683.1 hypothetical protein ME5_00062 [Bartonella tamiae Th239]
MEIYYIFAFFICCLLAIVFLFIKGHRKLFFIFIIAGFVMAIMGSREADKTAISEGFLNASDKRNAKEAGIINADDWTNEKREVFLVKKAKEEKENMLKKRADKWCNDKDFAYIKSKAFVKRSLKDPSSAKFPNNYHVDKRKNCQFSVFGYVSATNSFGGRIQSSYTILMKYLPEEDMWRGTNLQMN